MTSELRPDAHDPTASEAPGTTTPEGAAAPDLRCTVAVEYAYDDRAEQRDAVRPAHRTFLRGLLEDGRLLASGPTSGPEVTDPREPGGRAVPAGALLLLRAADVADALRVLDEDPFWRSGLVAARRARLWDPVIGPFAG